MCPKAASPWADDGFVSSRDEAVEAIGELVTAIAMARTEMRRAERSLRRALQSIAEGESIESLIALKPPAQQRRAFLTALEEVHRARHVVRQKVFTHALASGLTITQMSRAWGISRQLASRYVNEGNDRSGASPTKAAPAIERAETSTVVLGP
jgi:hypothetical protein